MARKKMTPLQEKFKKQINRIKNAVRRIRKRGYEVNYNIPQMPKRVTKKALEDISNVTTYNIYAESKYVIPDTGEVVSGRAGRTYEAKQAAKKRKKDSVEQPHLLSTFADIVITNYKNEVAKFNTSTSIVLIDLIDSLISEYGEEDVAEMLQKASEKGIQLNWQAMYDESGFGAYASELINELPQVGEMRKDVWRQRVDDTLEWYTYD